MALANRDDAALASLDAELENRAARERLLPYVLKTSEDYIAERIHRQVASALEALARREITRLMITAHPRSGKTASSFSQRFPVWYSKPAGALPHTKSSTRATAARSSRTLAASCATSSPVKSILMSSRMLGLPVIVELLTTGKPRRAASMSRLGQAVPSSAGVAI